MKVLLYFASFWLISLSAVLQASSAVVLVYHHVDSSTPPSTSISPENFRSHLDFLSDNDFVVLPLPYIIESLTAGSPLPDKTVAITFDDGYRSIYETAFPMLAEFEMPFTLFVSTAPIDQNQSNYLNWDELRVLSDAGVTIANHTANHPYMLEFIENESAAARRERNQFEIEYAQSRILDETGQNHKILAYPYGEFNPEIKQLVEELGFVGVAQHSGAINASSDFLALPRFPLASIYANLSTARTKIFSKAFTVEVIGPRSPVVTQDSATVQLQFAPGDYNLDQLGCFNSGQAMTLNWLDKDSGVLELTGAAADARRWRYICTAPDINSDRYFWYSVPWVRLND